MTFKDLQKAIQSLAGLGDNQVLQRLKDKPFWLWDPTSHKQADRVAKGDCCFNHIIGLPTKDGRNNDYRNSQMCIVTGPNQELAIKLIKRMKGLFEEKLGITFDSKETVLELNGCVIEAFPSNHLDAFRSLTNPKFILLDEADFFRKSEQEDVRHVSERYIAKSDPFIVMVSTPYAPDGLFDRIEEEPEKTCIYKRILMDYTYGLDKIYTREEIEKAKISPSFEREYNLQYLGGIGNVFHIKDIQYTQSIDYNADQLPWGVQSMMGVDPSPGGGPAGIVVTVLIDGKIRVLHAEQYPKADYNQTLEDAWNLIQKWNVSKVMIDASFPSLIRALKVQEGERPDYENVPKEHRQFMLVEPVPFGPQHKAMLQHTKFLIENQYVLINPKFDKLITSLKSATHNNMDLDKEQTTYDDVIDAFRLALKHYQFVNKEMGTGRGRGDFPIAVKREDKTQRSQRRYA